MQRLVRYIELIFILSGISVLSQAQDSSLFYKIDSSSYSEYLNSNWRQLKKTSRFAFRNDIDYYYLRMRAGIAFYETGNYRVAEQQFKKALKFNDYDNLAHEYYYYSQAFAGKENQAELYYSKHKKALVGKVPDKKSFINYFSFDIVNHFNTESNPKTLMDYTILDSLSGSQVITRNYFCEFFITA